MAVERIPGWSCEPAGEKAAIDTHSFWPWVSGTVSKLNTSVWQDWFPPLGQCTATPGCIGPRDAVYNALDDLVSRLSDPTILSDGSTMSDKAQSKVFAKIGTDANGNPLTTASFIKYLRAKRPRFVDGTRSGYCYDALLGSAVAAVGCWIPSPLHLIFGSVSTHFANNPKDLAYTDTPHNEMRTFFRPAALLYSNYGKNLGNEGHFHEALHGITGRFDPDFLTLFSTFNSPICSITQYIQQNVLVYSSGLDSAVNPCP